MNTNICKAINCFYFNNGAYGCNRYHNALCCHLIKETNFKLYSEEVIKPLENRDTITINLTPYYLYADCDKETINLLKKENDYFFESDPCHLEKLEIENKLKTKVQNIKMKLMYKNTTEHNLNLKEISLENNQLGIKVKTRNLFSTNTITLNEIETMILSDFLKETLDKNINLKIILNERIERRGLEYEKKIYIEKERIN